MRLNPDVEQLYEIDGVKFYVGPESLGDFLIAETRLPEDAPSRVPPGMIGAYQLIERIKRWEGVEDQDGNPAPCSPRTKNILFGQMPQLLFKLAKAMREQAEASEKNLERSHGGSDQDTPNTAATVDG